MKTTQQIKQEIATLKTQLKALEKVESGPSLFSRFGSWFRKKRLSIYENFEKRAENLRYQINDPENWEADQVVEDIGRALKSYQERVEKGKELTDSDKVVLTQFYTALHKIATDELGSNQDNVNLLIEDIQQVYPELMELTTKLDELLDMDKLKLKFNELDLQEGESMKDYKDRVGPLLGMTGLSENWDTNPKEV